MAEGGAALPWGAQTEAEQDANASEVIAESDLQPISIQQLGLEAGARIEVMWQVSTDEGEGEDCSKWFPATLSCSSPAQQQHAASPAALGAAAPTPDNLPSSSTPAAAVPAPAAASGDTQPHQQLRYTLTYDGSEEFPEETATVLLLSEHELYDVEKSEVMVWRCEGDSYEPAEDNDVMDARDIDVSDEEVAAGEAAMMARLASLTQSSESSKAFVMAGYQDFKEQLKAFIAAKAACAEGSDVLITTSDVQEFTNMMKTQRATAAAHRH